jgi:hypothetical protein
MRTLIYVLTLAASLTACGGGGGNPGTCLGGDGICARSVGAVQNPTAASYPAVNLSTITCPEILALLNNDRAAAFAAAQYYLAQGAVGLNGDPQSDKTACDAFQAKS